MSTCDADTAREARNVAHEITIALPNFPIGDVRDGASVVSGPLGQALLYAYADRVYDLMKCQAEVERCVLEAFNALHTRYYPESLYGGLTGVAWAIRQLKQLYGEELIDIEGIEEQIWEIVSTYNSTNALHFELVAGLAGLGQYALSAWPESLGEKLLRWVCTRLVDSLRPIRNGRGWLTQPEWLPDRNRQMAPEGYYNYGLAHGMPGALSILAAASGLGLGLPGLSQAIDDVTTYLEEDSVVPGHNFLRMADISLTGTAERPTRLAWCYGNPGCAVALSWAALMSGNSRLLRFSRQLGLDSLRTPQDESEVVDAGFCHGSSGLGHVYSRLYAYHGDDCFREAGLNWYRKTLALRSLGGGIAGFTTTLHGTSTWDASLLTGATGIALSLLAGTTEKVPHWDHVLMCGSAPFETQAGSDHSEAL